MIQRQVELNFLLSFNSGTIQIKNNFQYVLINFFTPQVYRVKHKLDGAEYAVKKISIRAEGIQSVRNYLSEVKTFASMNHSHIVQYKGAWLEFEVPTKKGIEHKETESFTSASQGTEYIYHQETTQSFTETQKDGSTDFQIDFEHSVSGANSVKSKPSTTSR